MPQAKNKQKLREEPVIANPVRIAQVRKTISGWIWKVLDRQGRRQWHPTPVLLPGKSHGWRSLVGCSPWGHDESDTTERPHFHFSFSCIGKGNGTPLQCSCLENPRDGGAWWAAVYGVAQSRTRLKWLSSSSSRQAKRHKITRRLLLIPTTGWYKVNMLVRGYCWEAISWIKPPFHFKLCTLMYHSHIYYYYLEVHDMKIFLRPSKFLISESQPEPGNLNHFEFLESLFHPNYYLQTTHTIAL